jgi:hypothetical protein
MLVGMKTKMLMGILENALNALHAAENSLKKLWLDIRKYARKFSSKRERFSMLKK